jgi:hypothetical protein
MYGINNPYYTKTFSSISELTQAVIDDGADPGYYITVNGKVTKEKLIDLIMP